MITLAEYNKNPSVVKDISKEYDNDVILNISLHFEIMNLQRKLDCAVITMAELKYYIGELIDNLNRKIDLWALCLFKIDTEVITRYLTLSLMDIIVYNGKYFPSSDDIFYHLTNCYVTCNEKEYNELIQSIYEMRYTEDDITILNIVNSLYTNIPKFNCTVIDFDNGEMMLLGKGLRVY